MINENKLKQITASNLIYYRKQNGLTQIQLADKLNYSDKAISKWERGESLPDLYILATLAEMYNITLNDLISEKKVVSKPKKKSIHSLITLCSVGIVWLICTIVFVSLAIFVPALDRTWLVFIYALPISFIVATVFSVLWFNLFCQFLSVSCLSWTTILAICLTINTNDIWLLFVILAPLQILAILWFIMRKKTRDIKQTEDISE